MFIYHLPIIRIEHKALMNIQEELQQNKGEKGKKREKEKNGKWNKKSGSANSITVSLHGHACDPLPYTHTFRHKWLYKLREANQVKKERFREHQRYMVTLVVPWRVHTAHTYTYATNID